MAPQVPFHLWSSLPAVLRRRLFVIGHVECPCIICGSRNHSIHDCAGRHSNDGQHIWLAWEKCWIGIMGQEYTRYSLCSNDREYVNQADLLGGRFPVDGSAVRQYMKRMGIPQPNDHSRKASDQKPKNADSQRNVQWTQQNQRWNGNRKNGGQNRNRENERQNGNARRKPKQKQRTGRDSTTAYGGDTGDTSMDDADDMEGLDDQRQSPKRGQTNARGMSSSSAGPSTSTSLVEIVRSVRTSRGTAMTPPPILGSAPMDAEVPQIAFRPIPVNLNETVARGRTTTRSPEDKPARSISSSAAVPTAKTGRSTANECVPPADQRGEEEIGSSSSALVAASQSNSRPYKNWTLELYKSSSTSSRLLFWQRASAEKKRTIARALSCLPEREEIVQEARLDFNASVWGLTPGVPPIDLTEDDII